MGNTLPDGGWYDEEPPKVIGSSPMNGGVNIDQQKISILFDEYIKVENANENVIISPAQIEQPEIKTKGKSIVVELKDTLKADMTYTIDFSDAIVDNNESNPLGNYTFTFSTGEQIDTMQVAGYVLDAETLEPLAGMVVGLYEFSPESPEEPESPETPDNLETPDTPEIPESLEIPDSLITPDSLSTIIDIMERHRAFTTLPMLRVARTDQNGHFSIKGVKHGTYHIYALKDVDNNFMLTPGTGETSAYTDEIVVTSVFDDVRQDTLWLDSLRIKDIVRVPYKHYMPDNIVLRAFEPKRTERAFLKSERQQPEYFSLFFTCGDTIMPKLRGLNFESDSAFIIEPSEHADTIIYWLRDTMLVNTDSLEVEMTYRATDTLGVLQEKIDTLMLLPKLAYEKRLREKEKKFEEWQKKQNKQKKRGEPYDSIMPREPLAVDYRIDSKLDPDRNPFISFKEPLELIDSAKIHLYYQVDTLWYEARHKLRDKKNVPHTLEVLAEWKPGVKYSLEIDSAAFVGIYGDVSKENKSGIEVKTLDSYGTFRMRMPELSGKHLICQLVDDKDKLAKQIVTDDGDARFFYLAEKEYYFRVIVDDNRNGKWDTGDFEKDQQPEQVFYYPKEIKCRAKWDLNETWNPSSTPLNEQKPSKLRKTKAATKKRQQANKNQKRAEQLGIPLPDRLQKHPTE